MDIYTILSNFNIVETGIGMIIGLASTDLIYSLSDEFIIPLIKIIFGITTIKHYSIKIDGHTLSIGLILINLARFLLMLTIVIILLQYVIHPVTEKVIEKKNETANETVHQLKTLNKNIKKIETEVKDQTNPNVFIEKKII